MKNVFIAYLIGVLTVLVIFLIFYTLSLVNSNIYASYNSVFCNNQPIDTNPNNNDNSS